MNQVEIWVYSTSSVAISKTLLHSLWQSAIAAAALAGLLGVVRSSRIRYAAACVGLLIVAGAPIVTLFHLNSQEESRFVLPTGSLLLPAEGRGELGRPSSSGLDGLMPWLSPLWLAGVLIFSSRNLAGWLTIQKVRCRGVCAAPEIWQRRLITIRRQLGISGPVELLESCFIHIPAVVGYVRPVVLVPVGLFSGLPATQMEMILMHELLHIRRCDYLVNMLQTCIEGLMFYNPVVWWISRIIRNEREHCCDDLVVAITDNAHGYAAALTALEESRNNSAQLAIAATGGSLMKRIHRLLQRPAPGVALLPLFSGGLLVVMATVILGIPIPPQNPVKAPVRFEVGVAIAPAGPVEFVPQPVATQDPVTGRRDAPSASRRPTPRTTVLDRWVNEDVAYIISDEERLAFALLQTDVERERFIQQFWQRRDPSPDTAANEFREDHYQRIAYVNERFGTAVGPGWRTDRGRIYIRLGKPIELESHGNGPDGAFELWRYPYIEGIGNDVLLEFVDRTGSGDYRLVSGLLVR